MKATILEVKELPADSVRNIDKGYSYRMLMKSESKLDKGQIYWLTLTEDTPTFKVGDIEPFDRNDFTTIEKVTKDERIIKCLVPKQI